MPSTDLLPLLAAFAFVACAVRTAVRPGTGRTSSWRVPAALSAAFLAFSLHAIASEGLLGFWTEHVRNAWGNQIWFDLLLAVGVAWYLILPEARDRGMRPLPWLALVIASGCIGLLAMLARLLWLREHGARRKNAPSCLVDAVESGAEPEFIIARNGRPAARLVPLDSPPPGPRLGVARGKFRMPDDIDGDDEIVAELFDGNA